MKKDDPCRRAIKVMRALSPKKGDKNDRREAKRGA